MVVEEAHTAPRFLRMKKGSDKISLFISKPQVFFLPPLGTKVVKSHCLRYSLAGYPLFCLHRLCCIAAQPFFPPPLLPTFGPAMAFEDVQITKPSAETYKALEADLCDHSGKVPLHERFRALFTLKALADNDSVDIIGRGKSSSQPNRLQLAFNPTFSLAPGIAQG